MPDHPPSHPETSPWIDALPLLVKAGLTALIGLGATVAGIYAVGNYADKIDLLPAMHANLNRHIAEQNAQMRELVRLQRITCRALAKSEATREQCDDYRAWTSDAYTH